MLGQRKLVNHVWNFPPRCQAMIGKEITTIRKDIRGERECNQSENSTEIRWHSYYHKGRGIDPNNLYQELYYWLAMEIG